MFDQLLEKHNPDLHQSLMEKGIVTDMFTLEPIMGLFTNVIPINYSVSVTSFLTVIVLGV